MATIIRTIVRDGEMDMKRRLHEAAPGRMRQLIAVFWPRSSAGNLIGKPRRSIDREQQEYAPFYE